MTGRMKSLLWTMAAVAAMAVQSALAHAGEVVWWAPTGARPGRELAKKFEAANPGITVKIEVTVPTVCRPRS